MKRYCVIGAGILGASTAYHLAKTGAHVTIIDRKDEGQATGAAAGIICPWLSQRRNKAWYRLAKGGARFYPKLIAELEQLGETNTGYAKVGALSLHEDEEKLVKMKERALKRREEAPEIGEVTIVSPAEAKALFPPLRDGYGAVHVSGAARVDGRALRDALLRATKKLGATLIEGNAQWTDNREIIVNDQTLTFDQIIITAGVWAKSLLASLDVQANVEPQKAQIIHFVLPNATTNEWPVIMPPNDQYMLAFDDRIVAGATHENEVGFDTRVTASGVHEVLDKALYIAPGLADATILETRVGFRPFTPGFLPVFGSLPGHEGILFANGLGASGLTMGPFIGAELAKLALGEETDVPLEDYDVASALS
ncbi:NAD(P)/FAD-dependent oxidoreductase [Bacillus sp. FJAT-42315]|uniref:NAD(P)/FAD-dependent oxidoreductase n=1 Tax=Bacillus sp. FJAT-42315 TaxID=2014077 RepID=UPI000C24DB65|nr:FAD-dependent oxidoreductase [Bacillus sp. FJAT-42315]